MPIRSLPARPSLELDKKAAKRLLRRARAKEPGALARIAALHPRFNAAAAIDANQLRLADVELVVAREYGFPSWPRFKQSIEALLADRATRADMLTRALCGNQLSRGLVLLEHEPDLAAHDFYTACACGALEALAAALQRDPQQATRPGGANGWQPLVYVCFSRLWRCDGAHAARLLACAELLLKHGADPNAHYLKTHDTMRVAQTCLYAAAGIANHPELTRLLLEAGADIDEGVMRPAASADATPLREWLDLHPLEALYHASEFRDVGCLRLLLEAGPMPRAVSYCFGRALDFDNEPAALLYLLHGADPNLVVPWHEGRSHLHKAVLHRRPPRIIQAMLDRGADPNLPDAHGVSPYRHAVRRGEQAISALLEQAGADRHSPSAEDRALGALVAGTAAPSEQSAKPDRDLLVRAARRNDLAEIARLIAAGADVNAGFDLPPLHAACYAGHLAAARLLVQHGAGLSQKSSYGGSPLDTCIYGSTECCDEQGGPGTLAPEEVGARDYAELTTWLVEQGAELPSSLWGGSESVQEALRRLGMTDPG